ncbi:MAG: hypothetical protein HC867_07680, partial [Bacteroidia bacterium]|nr:hypothetical protein [Bacteroidia bacterium]
IFFGIQLLLWTVSGIYFSWTNIKHIKGDDIRKEEPYLNLSKAVISPVVAIQTISNKDTVIAVQAVQIISVLDSFYYQVIFNNEYRTKARLVNVTTGCLRNLLDETEAIAVAKSRLSTAGAVTGIKYVSKVSSGHEYRNKPLPAYAITFDGAINSTVYVSTELGTVQSLRNSDWRIYDVLWMMHTMDFNDRSNF